MSDEGDAARNRENFEPVVIAGNNDRPRNNSRFGDCGSRFVICPESRTLENTRQGIGATTALQAVPESPSAVDSASLHLFWGPDGQAVRTLTPSPCRRLITPEELTCAKGHVYPLLLVRLALTWACEARTSYRGVALIFASLEGVVAAIGPCAETIRLWLLRVGLFLLRRPLPRCSDWVFLVDLTIQLGDA